MRFYTNTLFQLKHDARTRCISTLLPLVHIVLCVCNFKTLRSIVLYIVCQKLFIAILFLSVSLRALKDNNWGKKFCSPQVGCRLFFVTLPTAKTLIFYFTTLLFAYQLIFTIKNWRSINFQYFLLTFSPLIDAFFRRYLRNQIDISVFIRCVSFS